MKKIYMLLAGTIVGGLLTLTATSTKLLAIFGTITFYMCYWLGEEIHKNEK